MHIRNFLIKITLRTTLVILLFFLGSGFVFSQASKQFYGSFENVIPINVSKVYPRNSDHSRSNLGLSFGYRNFIMPDEKRVNAHYGLELLYRSYQDFYNLPDGRLTKDKTRYLNLLVVLGTTVKPIKSYQPLSLGLKAGFGPAIFDKKYLQTSNGVGSSYEKNLDLTPNRVMLSFSINLKVSRKWDIGLITTYASNDLRNKSPHDLSTQSVGLLTNYKIN